MTDTAVLISIKPKWVNLIFSGKKTVEVRKSIPKLDPPFTCYIYESGTGCVVGEFVCAGTAYYINYHGKYVGTQEIPMKSGLTEKQLLDYAGEVGVGFAWYISKVKEYETPLPVTAFKARCDYDGPCALCKHAELDPVDGILTCENRVQTPPQSWRYVQRRPE